MDEVIFVILPEVEILDLAGPLQVFHEAMRFRPEWKIRLCSPSPTVQSSPGLALGNLEPLPDAGASSLVVIPGMPYAATLRLDRDVIRWVCEAVAAGARVSSVCTGSFVLGEAGLLDRRRCTTHWNRVGELQRRYPRASVVENALFVSDGPISTSAGIASGIDMALAFIEAEIGPLAAASIAREMVVYMRRNGDHRQESVYVAYRAHIHPGIHRVQDHITHHTESRPSLEELAQLAGMSPRHLTRKFREVTGITVQDYSRRVRLERARVLLRDPELSIEGVASRCGFAGARQLRRVWREATGMSPHEGRSTAV